MNTLPTLLPDFMHFTSVEVTNLVLLLGLIMFLGAIGGRLFQKLRIPQVVGYIVIGIIIGSSGFQILTPATIAALDPISGVALSLIGFLIGAELKTSVIKKYGKQFTGILLFESIVPFIVVSIVVTTIAYFVTQNFPWSLSLGLVLGAISSATAPAATTDVLKENKTRGPLTTTVLGIVAMDDAVALILYAITSSFASALLGTNSISLVQQLLSLFYDIFGSMLVGSLMGFFLGKIIQNIMTDEGRILSFTLGTLFLVAGICSVLDLDNILAAMSMGFFLVNFAPVKTRPTFSLVEKFTPPIYVMFFVLVGAKLNIWSVTPFVGVIALVYVACRTIGKSLGSRFGAWLTKAPTSVRKYLPFCLLSQAGVAIGLSIAAGQQFSDATSIGPTIMLIITATTFIVQLLGPVCVKYGVSKAGECGLDIDEDDLIKNSLVRDLKWQDEFVCNPDSPSILKEICHVDDILNRFSRRYNQNYVVCDANKKLVGIITLESLKEAFLVTELSDCLLAMDIMQESPVICRPETSVLELKDLFAKFDVNAIPIVAENDELLGVAERHVLDYYVHAKMIELLKKADDLEKNA